MLAHRLARYRAPQLISSLACTTTPARLLATAVLPSSTPVTGLPAPQLTAATASHNSLPYFVPRSTDGTSLPIYQDHRQVQGDLTVIKHVRGDLNALAKDIRNEVCSALEETIHPKGSRAGTRRPRKQIHPVTVCERKRQVVVRGRWRRAVNDWFLSKGF